MSALSRKNSMSNNAKHPLPVGSADLLDVGLIRIRISLIVLPLPLNRGRVRVRDRDRAGLRRLGHLSAPLRVPELEDRCPLGDVR